MSSQDQQEITVARLNHRRDREAERIRALLFDAYAVEAQQIGVDDFPPLRRSARHIANSPNDFLGCMEADRLIAVAEIERTGENQVMIASFAVHPSVFRRGIGSQLLAHVLTAGDGKTVTVSTAARTQPAIYLYEKHGFCQDRLWTVGEWIEMVTLSRQNEL